MFAIITPTLTVTPLQTISKMSTLSLDNSERKPKLCGNDHWRYVKHSGKTCYFTKYIITNEKHTAEKGKK